ncbi:MAG: cytochrome c oxidase subunit II [Candidatus Roizmanbacteria bacterium GW2011_GWC2_37_13]|uniref:Cytochrome c oxidase subunit II n=1 Tax=Candidatus Roizmanbacteria bacterium GW2011_GWC2_37_13 TaxID=1618486 RepID=A0A0G0G2W4_9BACT|nr:MAG: cytochrome c oxidase subunit II [Candidatus Roizmanbacteria bacterium GW2011_GWC1_37_12]KKQ25528.1 MAG: cytochrome c oxidase subunit II [Candidatus Roizmanbacteria bacterium GW2011_GWC2_37_13]
MKNYLLIGLLVATLGVGGLYIFNQNRSVTSQEANSTEVISSPASSVSVKEFTLTAKQWAFDPATITVKQGDKVRLKITSLDVTHGFSLPDFNVKVDLNPNAETVVEFTADKTGEFTFFCSVVCGTGHNDMKGKLIVL